MSESPHRRDNEHTNPTREQTPHSGVHHGEKPVFDFPKNEDGSEKTIAQALEEGLIHAKYDDETGKTLLVPDSLGEHRDPTNTPQSEGYSPLTTPETAETDAAPGNKKKKLLALGAGAAGLVLAAGAYIGLSGEDKATEPRNEPGASAPANPGEKPSTEPTSPETVSSGEVVDPSASSLAIIPENETYSPAGQERIADLVLPEFPANAFGEKIYDQEVYDSLTNEFGKDTVDAAMMKLENPDVTPDSLRTMHNSLQSVVNFYASVQSDAVRRVAGTLPTVDMTEIAGQNPFVQYAEASHFISEVQPQLIDAYYAQTKDNPTASLEEGANGTLLDAATFGIGDDYRFEVLRAAETVRNFDANDEPLPPEFVYPREVRGVPEDSIMSVDRLGASGAPLVVDGEIVEGKILPVITDIITLRTDGDPIEYVGVARYSLIDVELEDGSTRTMYYPLGEALVGGRATN